MNRKALLPALLALVLVLTACGGSGEPARTPTPTALIAPTHPPGTTTVGGLIATIDAVWPSARSIRATSWSTGVDTLATPPATGLVTVEVVVRPSSRHVMQVVNGIVTDEQMLVNGRVYMRGTLVPAAIAPMMDTNTWVEVDAGAVTADSPVAMPIAFVTRPIQSPFTTVTPETRGLAAVPAGDVMAGGRTCRSYAFGAPGGIAFEIALDATGQPCRLVQVGGDQATVTIYEFNIEGLTITAPDLATPPPE